MHWKQVKTIWHTEKAKPKRYESTEQPGLYFWAEPVLNGTLNCFAVIGQADGFPASEAHDDWFGQESDADVIAQKLARGEV